MKTFIFLAIFATSFASGQSVQSIENKIKKSYYYSQFPETKTKFLAQKYSCIQKNYQYPIFTEKEFLNKKQILKKYPQWNKKSDNEIENRSIIQESLQPMQFDPNTKKHLNFPKCFKF